MPFQIPTLTGLRNRIEADYNTRLPGADSRLRRGLLSVVSFAHASASWSLYQYQAWIARQRLPDTAEDEELVRIGGVHGVLPTGAASAAGSATVSGVDPSPVVTGAVLQTADGVRYVVQADTAIAGGTATVQLRAAVAGAAGNQVPGTQLSFVAPVGGVNSAALVVSLAGGIDEELQDNYRGRLLDHLRSPPQGGAAGDYVQWARTLPGVTRAWEFSSWIGAGTVGVLFVFDGREEILPTADDVAAMQALLDAKRPFTTPAYAAAPVANPMNLTIAINPANDAVKAAVAAELADLIGREGAPRGTVLLNHIEGAIGLAVGAGDYRLDAPVANFTNAGAQIATLGVITWAAW
jgi:uncharacterized phage protein gp47/JayE